MIPSQNLDSKTVIGLGIKYDPAQIFNIDEKIDV